MTFSRSLFQGIPSAALCILLASCGGGGASDSPASPPPPAPPPPTGSTNQSPVLQQAATDQSLIVGHSFSYDASLGGTAVRDPDGDPLTWKLSVVIPGALPAGLSIAGTVVSGTPSAAGYVDLQMQVDDNRGGNTVFYGFRLRVAANSPPTLLSPSEPVLLSAGQAINLDATRGGAAFVDPDGDAISYSVSMRGDLQGLVQAGHTITGSMSHVGAVEVTVTADDHFGGVTQDLFMIAVPASITSTPTLPSPSYLYRDDELPLPYVFSMSSLQIIPLWDTQPSTNRTNDAGATLGRVLFYDKRLSVTNTMSCSTCHQQSHGFASPTRFDMGLLGLPMKRNSMALANVRYNIAGRWFADMRVDDLRKLVGLPLQSHDELGMTPTLLVSKLQAAGYYDALFNNAFGPGGITSDRAAAALAQFLQSLLSYRTRADQALNPMDNSTPNPSLVFTSQEQAGFEIYKAHCWICHESAANTNVWQANNGLDVVPADPGINNPALQRSGALGMFRAASLRNIALTGPYMHDGRFTTLRQVIDHYDSGIQASPDLDSLLKDSNGQPIRLNLSEADKAALESYLLTLTDDAMLADPKFADPFN